MRGASRIFAGMFALAALGACKAEDAVLEPDGDASTTDGTSGDDAGGSEGADGSAGSDSADGSEGSEGVDGSEGG